MTPRSVISRSDIFLHSFKNQWNCSQYLVLNSNNRSFTMPASGAWTCRPLYTRGYRLMQSQVIFTRPAGLHAIHAFSFVPLIANLNYTQYKTSMPFSTLSPFVFVFYLIYPHPHPLTLYFRKKKSTPWLLVYCCRCFDLSNVFGFMVCDPIENTGLRRTRRKS